MRSLIIALALAAALPANAIAANRVVTLAPGNPLAGAIRLGAATGGPSVHDVVPADVAAKVFKSAHDSEPANGWFTRTYGAALRTNGFLAATPAAARYELTAEVQSMAITPTEAGAHHKSVVTYRLREIATGTLVWDQTQATDVDVKRGPNYGKIAGMVLFAAATAAMGAPAGYSDLTAFQTRRPFDTRIDVYTGIMRGFDKMAEQTMLDLWFVTRDGEAPHRSLQIAAIPAATAPIVPAAKQMEAPVAARPLPQPLKTKPGQPREDVVEVIL